MMHLKGDSGDAVDAKRPANEAAATTRMPRDEPDGTFTYIERFLGMNFADFNAKYD